MFNVVFLFIFVIVMSVVVEEQLKGVGVLCYVFVKFGGVVISLVMVIFFGFFVFKILFGDLVVLIVCECGMSVEQVDQFCEQLGLNKLLWQQFFDYFGNVFILNFGMSYVYCMFVFEFIGQYFWNMIFFIGIVVVIVIVLGLWFGQKVVWKYGFMFDCIVLGILFVFWLVLIFWLVLLFLMIFGGMLYWFLIGGMVFFNLFIDLVGVVFDVILYMVFLVIMMVVVVYVQYFMVMCSLFLEEMGVDYFMIVCVKGLCEDFVCCWYVVLNVLLLIVIFVFMYIGGFIVGVVMVEMVFFWFGFGKFIFEVIFGFDLFLLQGIFVVFFMIIIVMNFVVDFIYCQFDLRVRCV